MSARDVLIEQITAYLDEHESSPSACCIIYQFANSLDELDDAMISYIYERSEGKNDEERDALIKSLDDAKLMELAALCLEVTLEKLRDPD